MDAQVTPVSGAKRRPKVSVGMPVWNAEKTLATAIDAIIEQTFSDFELIISDNASTDATESICRTFASRDPRIIYIRQLSNLGAMKNFQFVLQQAVGEYFMWAAADDFRTSDFIEETVQVLSTRQECMFSSTPHCFDGEEGDLEKRRGFELRGNLRERFGCFLESCWQSHACFYSLIRRQALGKVLTIGDQYLAVDWSIIIELLEQGEFHRTSRGLLILGCSGESMQPDHIKRMRTLPIEHTVPFYKFSMFFSRMVLRSDELNIGEKVILAGKMFAFNGGIAYGQLKGAAVSYVKQGLRLLKSA